ncbi:MAG TPA: enoyl-CoA hydratase/isomerase family protein [Burkholderiaceae bacterium]|nr:enoyl-CoA hydratase/isomerase family protein [Burkholderiaceae bacterium]
METTFTALQIERRGASAWIWMNRPALHNAFDETLIAELTSAFETLDADRELRIVILAGHGKSFSAGADLNWMKRQGAASLEHNLDDARKLAQLYRTLSQMAKPTIARVHGAALGGGMGLACAADICVASTQATFATSEVRFGIIPSAISPYVIRAIGERHAYRYFQTAERITADRARELGLAHEVVAPDQLDACVQQVVDSLLAGGPLAQAAATDLIRVVAHKPVSDEVVEDTARRIAQLRSTAEAREGLTAFLEKRPAAWAASQPRS